MGHESLVYGCIAGTEWKISDSTRLQRANQAVIDALPERDEWPFLTRPMFAVAGPDVQSGLYRSQPIHFGATFKAVEWEWHEWLAKFEAVLARLFWDEVRLHLRTELVGHYDYCYVPFDGTARFFQDDPPRPAAAWRLTGGPRRFSEEDAQPQPIDWVYEGGVWRPAAD